MLVLTIGSLDCFHYGHLRLLERAAHFGDLFVGVNSDHFIKAYKGVEPVVPQDERMRVVQNVWCVRETLLNDGPGDRLIREVKPDLIAIGSDWHENDYLEQINISQRELDRCGIGVLYLPRTPGISTTELRAA